MVQPEAPQPKINRDRLAARMLLALVGITGLITIVGQSAGAVDPGSAEAGPPALFIQTD